jgi:hypothetical protein
MTNAAQFALRRSKCTQIILNNISFHSQ